MGSAALYPSLGQWADEYLVLDFLIKHARKKGFRAVNPRYNLCKRPAACKQLACVAWIRRGLGNEFRHASTARAREKKGMEPFPSPHPLMHPSHFSFPLPYKTPATQAGNLVFLPPRYMWTVELSFSSLCYNERYTNRHLNFKLMYMYLPFYFPFGLASLVNLHLHS